MALCAGIVAMAHTLGIEVIAEGIETEQQQDLLIDIGCNYGQGYFLARPMPASQFEQIYLARNLDLIGSK